MAPVTNTILGCTKISPNAAPKDHRNLTSIYINHKSSIPTSSHNKASKQSSCPQLTMVYINHYLDGPVSPNINPEISSLHYFAAQNANIHNRKGLFRLPPKLRIVI